MLVTYDGSGVVGGMNIYINSILDNDATPSGGTVTTITSTHSLKIGKYTGGQFYEGNIDEVAIFNTELSSSDVTAIYNSGVPNNLNDLSTPPVSWYRNGDPNGQASYPTITDDGSASNDGTMTNMIAGDIVEDTPS